MTRNVYLGADLTPAVVAGDLPGLADASGQILREVTANDFPTRAEGLAFQILERQPDLVGLEEVALWGTGPPSSRVRARPWQYKPALRVSGSRAQVMRPPMSPWPEDGHRMAIFT